MYIRTAFVDQPGGRLCIAWSGGEDMKNIEACQHTFLPRGQESLTSSVEDRHIQRLAIRAGYPMEVVKNVAAANIPSHLILPNG